jgi:hypothetical protein
METMAESKMEGSGTEGENKFMNYFRDCHKRTWQVRRAIGKQNGGVMDES